MRRLFPLLIAILACAASVTIIICFKSPEGCDIKPLEKEVEVGVFTKSERDFRLLSYNVRHCAGADLPIDYDKIANIIIDLDADFVCLQELDSVNSRSVGVDQIGRASCRERVCLYV